MTDDARSPQTPARLPGFPPAERLGAQVEFEPAGSQGVYNLRVFFVEPAPELDTVDRVLRECTALAAAHEGRHTILVDAYLLADAATDRGQRKTLSPYGRNHFLCYDPRLGRTGVRRVGTQTFVETLDGLREDNRTNDDDGDAATETLLTLVHDRLWYGFHSPAEIDALIDQDLEGEDGVDPARIRAFAAEELARKRAAEATWPPVTDCDRLENAFERLQAQGICALHFPGYTLQDGHDAVYEEITAEGVPPGRYQGFCFYHAQDMDRALAGQGLLLAFGSTHSEEDDDMTRVGRMVCDTLTREGLATAWNGTAGARIALPGLRWQRRTPD